MKPRFFRYPGVARLLYNDAVFRQTEGDEKKVYLTFDDGPTEKGTEEIINILSAFGVSKAVFFCTGSKMPDYPGSIEMIRDHGFSVANHGYHHIDGWKSRRKDYIDNCLKGSELSGSSFFRPPYGRLTLPQYRGLKDRVKIVFWDLLLYDFDLSLSRDYIVQKAEKLIRPGSVIVLHDRKDRCSLTVLEKLIGICMQKGYGFGDITD
ncbi:MAG: polysaccharide deacetylase family protein [Bacteroidales bacterium]|nr:polysaccharide deacetylase family protein [Bacteroidales bacterium]